MSFYQPWMLWALPLVALPIIIHLINQRRYQTQEWGAMKFLLSANRMSRGYARLRRWLIMAMRMAAIAGLIFAVSRPLASGWLGLAAGGKADTTLVLLDRSPSMQQQAAGSGVSKLDTARQQLVETLETLGSARWVLIDSGSAKPQELRSPAALLDSPQTLGVSAAADLPTMLQAAHDYIKANKPGATEIWIASDLRENDWQAGDGRWASLREAFLEFPQEVRFHLLAFGDAKSPTTNQSSNKSIRVTEVRREQVGDRTELVLSLVVTRDGPAKPLEETADQLEKQTLPLQFDLGGARSEMNLELVGAKYELKDHRLPVGERTTRGWGKVTLPADSNPADDEAYFVFDEPTTRRTAVVAEVPERARSLQLATSISPLATLKSEAEVVEPDGLSTLAWEELALVLWQAPLPTDENANLLEAFVDRGGQVVFFPPRNPTTAEFAGVGWGAWVKSEDPIKPENWRSDQGLLAKTNSGAALPVGKWRVMRYATIETNTAKTNTTNAGTTNTETTAEFIPLASLPGAVPLVARVPTDRGGIYFCATSTAAADSSLASDGVVLYVALQRLIDAGVGVLGDTRQQTAGKALPTTGEPWRRNAGSDSARAGEALSTDYHLHRGVYESADQLLAVNRPWAEDAPEMLSDARVEKLFDGLKFDRVEQQAGTGGGLVQEIWRLFLMAMMLALVVEAILCLPKEQTAGAELTQARAKPVWNRHDTSPNTSPNTSLNSGNSNGAANGKVAANGSTGNGQTDESAGREVGA